MCFFDFFCTLLFGEGLIVNKIEIAEVKTGIVFKFYKTFNRGTTSLEKIIC